MKYFAIAAAIAAFAAPASALLLFGGLVGLWSMRGLRKE